MRYKKLGRSGLLVSEMCLGTMTFGGDGMWRALGALGEDDSQALVKAAFDGGVNFFDTADVYANGLSEQLLGKAIRALGLRRDEIVVATKGMGRLTMNPAPDAPADTLAEAARRNKARNVNGTSRKHLFDAIDASLKRLDVDYVDLYQIHGVDPLTPIDETLDALNDIVRSGRVRYIGLCNLAAWQVSKALGISERKGTARFVSAQMYYSIGGRDLEREVVPMAVEEGLAILPWSPLAGGFLSGKYTREGTGPEASRRLAFDFPPIDKARGFDIIDVLRTIGDAHGVSVARVALAWLLHKPAVTSVIVGAKTVAQLQDNLAAADVRLSEADMRALDDVSALPKEYPGWMFDMQGADRRGQI